MARAAEHGMDVLALTDRDGTYGAVKFAKACASAGLSPVLGVDLAVVTDGSGPAWGHAARPGPAAPHPGPGRCVPRGAPPPDHSAGPGGPRVAQPVPPRLRRPPRRRAGPSGGHPGLLAPYLAEGDLLVLLGPGSELGAMVTRRRDDLAHAVVESWRELVPRQNLLVELVSHRLRGSAQGWGPGSTPHAARMASLSREMGLGAVLTNAVRVRRPSRRPDRGRPGRLAPAGAAGPPAPRPGQRGGLPQVRPADARDRRRRLSAGRAGGARGRPAAGRDPGRGRALRPGPACGPRDRGGALPRAGGGGRPRRAGGPAGGRVPGGRGPARAVRGRHRGPLRQRPAAADLEAARRRAPGHRLARLRLLLPHRRRRHRPGPRDGGAVRRPRLGRRQPGQLPARHLGGGSAAARPADGAVPLPAAAVAAGHRPRRGVGPSAGGLRGDPGPVRGGAVRLRLDDGDLPGPARGPGRGCRAGDATRRGRRDGQGVPARAGPGRPAGPAGPARAAGQRPGGGAAGPLLRPGGAARRPAPAHRGAPLRCAALRHHAARPHAGRGQSRRVPDEPVRQGRRGGPGAAQAGRAGHPDAVGDGPRGGRGRPGRRGRAGPRRPGAGPLRGLPDLRPGQLGARRWASSRSSPRVSGSWSASRVSSRWRRSSPTSRSSGRDRSRAT